MPRSFVALLLALGLLFLCGCAGSAGGPASEAPAMEASAPPAAAAPAQSEAPRTAMSSVLTEPIDIFDAQTLSDESFSCAAPGVQILHIGKGGDLQADGLTLDKTGDSPAAAPDGPLPAGGNAAVVVTDGGAASIRGSAITSGAAGGHALLVSGRGSSAALTDTMIITTGEASAALYVHDGGASSVTACGLHASDGSAACLFVSGGGSIACKGTQLSADAEAVGVAIALCGGDATLEDCTVQGALRFYATGNTLRCVRTAITGDIRFSAAEDEAQIHLTDNSSLRGTVEGDGAIGISIALDSSSRWQLMGDAYVAGLTDADAALSNIESNGFSLYYNSEHETNAWLESKTRALPGGGFLIPLI